MAAGVAGVAADAAVVAKGVAAKAAARARVHSLTRTTRPPNNTARKKSMAKLRAMTVKASNSHIRLAHHLDLTARFAAGAGVDAAAAAATGRAVMARRRSKALALALALALAMAAKRVRRNSSRAAMIFRR
jgi:hypothetical protein